MAGKKQVAVLGLGTFGQAVARELAALGHDVLAVDANPKVVQTIADDVAEAVTADVTNPEALAELGLQDFDAAIIGTSNSLEVSVLATVHLKRLGVRQIFAKADNEIQGDVLERVGADRIIHPELETGRRLAHSFAALSVADYFDVAPGSGFARVPVPPTAAGRTIGQLDLPGTCRLSVMALRHGPKLILLPGPHQAITAGDDLIVAGLDEDLERLPSVLGTGDQSRH